MDEPVNTPLAPPPKEDATNLVRVRGRWRRICIKELKETLRDRRTIITLVLMPLLVYPLLSVVFNKFFITSLGSLQEAVISIGTDSPNQFASDLWLDGALLETEPGSDERAKALKDRQYPGPELPSSFEAMKFGTGKNLEIEVETGRLSLAVLLKKPAMDGQASQWELVVREDSISGKTARQFVQSRLLAVNNALLERRLAQEGVAVRLPEIVATRSIPGEAQTFSMTTLIPLILILMTITGAVYPAIDLTAGERERGTLEPLMAAPIPRIRLLLAKYVAVVVVALLTAVANLVAMAITLTSSGLEEILFGDAGLTVGLVISVFALLVLFAAFFSAIVLALSSFARSFKEAQAYLIPLMLLCLAPGVMSLMPGLEFTRILAITPLVNMVVLARDIFEGSVDPVLACMAVASTALYALAAICLAARIYGTDAILYGSQATWSDFLRRPDQPRRAATIPGAAWCLALTFPVCVIALSSLARVPASMSVRIALAGGATVMVFGGVPLACALVQRVRIGSGFGLRLPKPLAFAAAMVMGVSLWPFAHELFLLNQTIGLDPLSDAQKQRALALMLEIRAIHPAILLFSLAIAPAVFEEFLFRGFLYTALRQRLSALATIGLTAFVFGAFHVVAASALTPERFLPSTFLGLVLGWVCHRSGSVLPGMLLHACHNGLMLMVVRETSQGSRLPGFLQVSETGHAPAVWLAAALVGVLAGAAILLLATRQLHPGPKGTREPTP